MFCQTLTPVNFARYSVSLSSFSSINPISIWPVRSHALNWKKVLIKWVKLLLLTVQIQACRSHLFGLVRLGRGGVHVRSDTWSFVFSMPFWRKGNSISSDHFVFPNPPTLRVIRSSWGGGSWLKLRVFTCVCFGGVLALCFVKHWCQPYPCLFLWWSLGSVFCQTLTPVNFARYSVSLSSFSSINPISIWPVRSHALNWKKVLIKWVKLLLLTVQIQACIQGNLRSQKL